jgi:uncharacterized RDD family membrane protein YckC/Tfp pilus assembly major pilin PilA
VEAGALACSSCGTPLTEPTAPPPPAAPHSDAASTPGAAIYAGFWRRVGAYLVDYVILITVAFVAGIALGLAGVWSSRAEVGFQAIFVVAYWLYVTGLESSVYQATLGKLALRIKVTDYAGQRIGFGRANGRFFGSILSNLTLGIGYLMAGFTRRRQALHDKVARTLVVKKLATSDVVAAGPAAPPVPAWAIVLLILAGMLPTIGVMAALAIPAYADYRVRDQVVEGLTAARPYQRAVADAVAAGHGWDEIDSASLELPLEPQSPYVQSIEVAGGAIAVTYGGAAASGINPAQLALIPGLDDGGEVVWTCGYAPIPDDTDAVLDEHEQYTNVPEKYLPTRCRGGSGGATDDEEQ